VVRLNYIFKVVDHFAASSELFGTTYKPSFLVQRHTCLHIFRE